MESTSLGKIRRNRAARLAKLATRSFYLHKRGRDRQMYQLIFEEMVKLGGVYIKFMQGVLYRTQAMQEWQSPERLNVFEDLHTEPINIVALLQQELSAEKLSNIASVQPQPFAAGSFGQVYYGTHRNGKPVIIKVLRPMVGELLKSDLKLLGRFGKSFFTTLYKNMDLNVDSAMKEFQAATLRETDYIEEARFARELYEAYKDHPLIMIPETYQDLCTDHVIVQEYVDGISVAQIIQLQEQGIDPKEYVQKTLGSDLDQQLITLGYEAVLGIFTLQRIQGDPHPGNIRLMSGNRVGILDFGISARTPHNKAAFFGLLSEWNKLYKNGDNITHFFEQFVRFFVNDLYRALKRLGTLFPTPNGPRDFTEDVGQVAQGLFEKSLGEHDIKPMLEDGRALQMINEMVNQDNRFGLVMRFEESEVLRAASTYFTLVASLHRRLEVLPIVFESVVARVRELYPTLEHQQDKTMDMSRAIETISNWLERVAERDPVLFRQLTSRINLNHVKMKKIGESANA